MSPVYNLAHPQERYKPTLPGTIIGAWAYATYFADFLSLNAEWDPQLQNLYDLLSVVFRVSEESTLESESNPVIIESTYNF